MNESKIELTHRLQREGLWPEASKFKDERIALHRLEGLSREKARQTAWGEMEARYPPLESNAGDLEIIPVELDTWPENADSNFSRDVMWVYGKMALPNVKPSDAPSAGAWSLLQWAQRHQDRFYEQTMPKAIAADKKHKEKLDEDLYVDNMENITSALESLHQGREERAIANTSETVKQRVKDISHDWQRRFNLDISRDAILSLERLLIGVVDEFA